MSSIENTAARDGRPRTRRSSAGVMAQYVQDLSRAARTLSPRQAVAPRGVRTFPARVTPVPCS